MSYEPRPGSIAAKALAHLREFGGPLATAVLAEAIDADKGLIGGALEYAVRNGAIACHKREGLCWWSAGDGKPPEREVDEPLKTRTSRREGLSLREIAALPRVPPAPVEFVCGIFSDGRLVLEFGEQIVTLDRDQTVTLVRFLDRLAHEVAA